MEKALNLLEKFRNRQCTEEELRQLRIWFDQQEIAGTPDIDVDDLDQIGKDMWKAIDQHATEKNNGRWSRWAVAASILLFLGIGIYIYRIDERQPVQRITEDIAPGDNEATLTLSNGKKISLLDAKEGELVQESGVHIQKTALGELTYILGQEETVSGKTNYNILETPRGGQHQLVLPDGSRVWLNAASSLKFPVSFRGLKTRRVELEGEAYFEIDKRSEQPFEVLSSGQLIEVLGTRFNVNNYSDESGTITTLLQGSVRVSTLDGHSPQRGSVKILKPGEQSVVNQGNIQLSAADMEEATAWKDGDFMFRQQDLPSAMRQIARWYNVEVVYEASAPTDFIPGGAISRSKNLSAVLGVMESTGRVHFKIEGRRVRVTK